MFGNSTDEEDIQNYIADIDGKIADKMDNIPNISLDVEYMKKLL